MEGGLVPSC
jgi:hypothetical protein